MEERGIMFCRTKLGAQKLAQELSKESFSVAALEGDMQQKELGIKFEEITL